MAIVYWILCIIIGFVPAYLVYRNDRKKNIPVSWLPALLRFLTFFTTAALLLASAFSFKKNDEEKPLLIWLQDNSTSFGDALKSDTAKYRKDVQAVFDKWGNDYNVVPIGFGENTSHDSVFSYKQRVTNISNAIQTAADQYQDRNIGAIILSTDGVYNEGVDPLYLPVSNTIPVYTIASGDSAQPRDISVARVFSNKTVASGSMFEIIADVRADKLSGLNTNINLQQNGGNIKSVALLVDKDRFSGSVHFEVKATGKGFQKFTLAIPAAEGEQNVRNNKMDFFVNIIDEENKILLLAAAPHPDINAIKEALESVPQYKVEVRIANDFPDDAAKYNLVIAHQMPAVATNAERAKHLPIWYIVGTQSNVNVINQLQNVMKLSAGAGNTAQPALNPSFSYFTLPQNIRDVLAKMPPLLSAGNASSLSGVSQSLLNNQTGNAPIWAIQTGETPQAILNGEGLWRWRLYEYKNYKKHDVVDELIRQTVSLLSVRRDKDPFKVFMDKYVLTDNEQVYLYAELRNANLELINSPQAALEIKDSAGKALNYSFEKTSNSYRINLGLLAPGNYSFKGSTTYNGKSYESSGSFVVESMPLESLRTNADYGMLYQLSKNTGGIFFTRNNFMNGLADSIKANKSIAPVIHTQETHEPLINKKWLFFLILLFAAAEWLLRKYWNV